MFAIAAGPVQGFVSQLLRQTHQVVAVVVQEMVRHRVPDQMGMELPTDQGGILLAQCPDASFGQCVSFIDEDTRLLHRFAVVKTLGTHAGPTMAQCVAVSNERKFNLNSEWALKPLNHLLGRLLEL